MGMSELGIGGFFRSALAQALFTGDGVDRVSHEDVRELNLYVGRNPARHPVGDALLTISTEAEVFGQLRRPTKLLNEFFIVHSAIITHYV